MDRKTYGIILSGGHGTRLKPLTDHTPKSLIEINKRPVLEYLLYYMRCAGISDIACISDVQKPVRPWLEENEPTVRIVDQDSPDGTGQAAWLALKDLTPKGNAGLMVMLGDIVPTDFLLADMVRKSPRHSILGVYPTETPSHGATVEYDRKRWMNRIEEKPEYPNTYEILSGIFYFWQSDYFYTAQSTLIRHGVQLKGEYDLIGAITLMHQYGEMFKCVENPVFDIGTFERIAQAEQYFENKANRQ